MRAHPGRGVAQLVEQQPSGRSGAARRLSRLPHRGRDRAAPLVARRGGDHRGDRRGVGARGPRLARRRRPGTGFRRGTPRHLRERPLHAPTGGPLMPIPIRKNLRVGAHLFKQRLKGRKYYPFIVEIEPLFACNLACPGCGKIQYPTDILRKRLSVSDVVGAVEESGTPMVSIAGGEPLLHPEIDKMVDALVKRKVYVYLCTNAVLMRRKLDKFTPSRYFSWVVHVDGLRERHDAAVDREGVFDEVVLAVKAAKERGFRVTTNSTFFNTDSPKTVRDVLDFLNDDLGVDAMMISPGYAYEKAPDQEHFMGVEQTRALFAEAFSEKRRKRWRLNHSPLFLDFLEGKVDFS